MPRGVPKKAAENGQVNRAELIRQTAKKMGKKVRPRDIIAALKEQGIVVSHSLVTKTLKRAGFKPKTHGKKAGARKETSAKKAAAAAADNGAAGQINKAQRIREVAKTLGKKVRPKDVIAELAEEGITVSSAQVSTTLAAAGYRRKRRGKKSAVAARNAGGNGLNLEALIAAKALANKLGGIEMAQEALAALKKLG